MSRSRRRAAEIALLAGVLLACLPLAEIVLRFVAPQPLPSQEEIRRFVLRGMYVADARAGYTLAPGFSGRLERAGHATLFSTNALGLRSGEVGPKARPRVLALGDSMTWGWGVAQGEEWVHQAGREIARRGGPELESLNGGVNGYGTEGALCRLEDLGPKLSPDLVLLGFFANDYADNLVSPREAYTVRDGYLFDLASERWFREHWLARHSHLWRLWAAAGEAWRVKEGGGPLGAGPARRLGPEDFQRGMEVSEALVARMAAVSRSLGARLAVVWLPPDAYTFAGSRPGDIPLQAELQRRLAAAGVPSFDLLPVLTAEPDPRGLYLPRDGHFTVRGHQVAGAAVGKWVVETGLLSREPR
jgi:lysophospholipase L1-like esterase